MSQEEEAGEEDSKPEKESGIVYILSNECNTCNKTYVGWTVNPGRRIRQHNGQIKGGAKRTCQRVKSCCAGRWRFAAHIAGFKSRHDALGFEKYMHIRKNRLVGRFGYALRNRIEKAHKIMLVYAERFNQLNLRLL
jgi:structure-specific endonuclease subunit SLX1